MKKQLSILLLFAYACSFVCAGYNLHFCSGHLKSITLAQFHKSGCCNKGEKPNRCCKDVFLKCKSSDQTQAKVVIPNLIKDDTALGQPQIAVPIHLYVPYASTNERAFGDPPDFPSYRLYIVNRRLLI